MPLTTEELNLIEKRGQLLTRYNPPRPRDLFMVVGHVQELVNEVRRRRR